MSGSRRRLGPIAAALVVLVYLAGCETPGGVSRAELPEDVIAISYRTPEEARRRADDFDDMLRSRGQEAGLQNGGPRLVGSAAQVHADMSQFGTFLGDAFGRDRSQQRNLGRLALLNPATDELSIVEGAMRGALPLDWSQDHSRLLFVQVPPGSSDVQLWEYHRVKGTVRPVTRGPSAHTQGCYGPDGRIVVTRADVKSDAPTSSIWISQAGGRRPFVRLSGGMADHTPACAPDGSALVFARAIGRDTAQIVARVPVLSGQPRPLTSGHEPAFSNDGEWVIFSAGNRDGRRLWRIRPDGTGRSPLGRSSRDELRPAISPDGRFIAYVASEIPPRVHLYLRRFDGSGDRILFADGDAEYPVW